IPPIPKIQSPVDFFRQLLALTPAERLAALTNRPPEMRVKILAKVREYQALGADERELRLRATELRWYLVPLLRMSPTNRVTRLAMVPPEMQELVKSRLLQWDILPPPLHQEFLTNDSTLHYFARVAPTNTPAANPDQQKIAGRFNQFFELTTAEKRLTLNTLSVAERAQMEKTLQSFEKLPPRQRLTCVRNYAKFAGMSGIERAAFLKNADDWSKMSPAERQTWRDLVKNVPLWPPMPTPTAIIPPNLIPHVPPKIPRPNVATNLN
ncbi:MAG TPA: DUF3106 domain-containing protein, partial [Verrucomicrobiae bacterium]